MADLVPGRDSGPWDRLGLWSGGGLGDLLGVSLSSRLGLGLCLQSLGSDRFEDLAFACCRSPGHSL